MKVIILGGTGAIGTSLVQCLIKRDIEIFITSRKKHKSYGKVHYIQGNAKQLDFLKRNLIDNYDCIVDFMTYTTEEFKERKDIFLSCCKQYIFISTARVYANSNNLLNEDSPRLLDVCDDQEYLATDEYALSKARQENMLFENSDFLKRNNNLHKQHKY